MDDNTQLDKVDDSIEEIPDTVKTQLSVESLIKSLISNIARVKEDLKPVKEMLSDLLNNNEKYQLADKEAKEASKKKSTAKLEILSTPAGKMASSKAVSLKAN